MKMINIGFGNLVAAQKIVSVVSPESAPIKRMIQDARDKGRLIDASYGRKSRSAQQKTFKTIDCDLIICYSNKVNRKPLRRRA